jgi:hypothetical protein
LLGRCHCNDYVILFIGQENQRDRETEMETVRETQRDRKTRDEMMRYKPKKMRARKKEIATVGPEKK